MTIETAQTLATIAFALLGGTAVCALVVGVILLGHLAWQEMRATGLLAYILSFNLFIGAFVVPMKVNSNSGMVFVTIMMIMMVTALFTMIYSLGEFKD